MTLILAFLACGQDISVTETARCDGVLQASEEWVDQPFDKDEDGYPDGGNLECQEAYEPQDLDCDDNNIDINPSAVEIDCNQLDDDCDDATPDEDDRDGDDFTSCEDCDDTNADVNPLATEILCNGVDDDCDETTEDEVDQDGDEYSVCDLDCNDEDAQVNPGMEETICNGVDDDCSETTPDANDADSDGVSECSDCDDDDVMNFPGNWEICDDEADNDCDTTVDEGCVTDYSGTWTLDERVEFECAEFLGVPAVSLNFQALVAVDINPSIEFGAAGAQPGTMTGTFSSTTEFSASRTISGSCEEKYSIEGEFLDANSFEATFSATYTPTGAGASDKCDSCDPPGKSGATYSWTIVGTK